MTRVIVVNDGSATSCLPVFQVVAAWGKVTVLHHEVNLGKGAALKSGIRHFLEAAVPGEVLVTADADGQHLVEDILAVAHRALEAPDALVLGSRAFSGEVPLRSRFGNGLTRTVFRLLLGQWLMDTQTGLRAIPSSLLADLLLLRSVRYEFELEMLVRAVRRRVALVQVPIQTVYLDGNQDSHFNPLLDSVRIYAVFVRCLSVAGVTVVLDWTVFVLMLWANATVVAAVAAGQVLARSVGLLLGRREILHQPSSVAGLTVRRLALQLGQVGVSALLVGFCVTRLHWHPYAAKLAVDGVLLAGRMLLRLRGSRVCGGLAERPGGAAPVLTQARPPAGNPP